MKKTQNLDVEAKVEKCLPGAKFMVKLENGHQVRCTISGKMRQNMIRVMVGDSVTIKLSPYDLTQGIITRRH